MFEQANRLGIHFSWNARVLGNCQRDPSGYKVHRMCKSCQLLSEQLRNLYNLGCTYSSYFQGVRGGSAARARISRSSTRR